MAKREYDIVTKEEIIELIKRSRLPVLTLDRKWLNIFNTDEKSDEIAILEKR